MSRFEVGDGDLVERGDNRKCGNEGTGTRLHEGREPFETRESSSDEADNNMKDDG